MFKYTFNSFATGKQGAPIERYELPMILDGKYSSAKSIRQQSRFYSHFTDFSADFATLLKNF